MTALVEGRSASGSKGLKAGALGLVATTVIAVASTAPGYFYMNKADADCGTTFAWATRAFGPSAGWLGSWGLIVADLLIMPNLAGVSGQSRRSPCSAPNSPSSACSRWSRSIERSTGSP